MAKKKSDLPPAVRIRDNQRRARQRQKDLIEELQQRIAKHERQGVQATLAMQQAARRVAHENGSLRALLAVKGIPDEEVRIFLAQRQDDGIQNCTEIKAVTNMTGARSCVGDGLMQSPFTHSTTAIQPQAAQAASGTPAQLLCTSDASPTGFDSKLHDQASDVQYAAHSSSEHTESSNSPFATSCVEAAELLVAIHGQDRDQAMISLGCKGRSKCSVSNVELLDIMDT